MLTYVDSSIALAHLYREPRAPQASFWRGPKVSSRLLEFEIWTRLHGHGRADTHGGAARDFLIGIELLEVAGATWVRALQPFPVPMRTLDSLHLATMEFIRSRGEDVHLASYDNRMLAGARAMGIPVALCEPRRGRRSVALIGCRGVLMFRARQPGCK